MDSESMKVLQRLEETANGAMKSHREHIEHLTERVETIEAKDGLPGRTTATNSPEMKAFAEYARTGSLESKEMSIAGGAANGEALVPEKIADDIINKALAQGRVASLVRNTSVDTSDYVRLVNKRGQSASWSSEAGSRSETDNFLLREVRPTHGEIYAHVTVTNWLLNDSKFDVANLIMENATAQFARAIETAVISGSGSNRPTGLLANTPLTTGDDASPERAADVLKRITATSDLADSLITAYFDLKPEYRQNASFVMSSPSLAVVRKLRDSNGSGYLFQQNAGVAMDAADGLLIGKPVITAEDLSTIGNSPQVFGVLVGDFQQAYELVRIGGLTVIRDPYSTKGKTTFYIAARLGGRITDNDAVRAVAA